MDLKRLDWALQRIQMVSEASKQGLLRDPKVLWNLSQAIRTSNPSKEWQRVAASLQVRKLFNPKPFPPPDSSVTGSIGIAIADNGQVIGVEPGEVHSILAGTTGSGKSTALRCVFSQSLAQGSPIWMFVKDGHDARSLLDIDRDILVVDFQGAVKFNPLNLCGMPREVHANVLSDIYCQAMRVYDGTKNYLMELLPSLYGSTKTPSMHDLFAAVKSQRHSAFSRAARYQESASNRLGGLLSGSLGKVFDCSVGHEESLLNMNCIFEIGTLASEHQIFLTNLLVTQLFYHRLRSQDGKWKLVGIDDANLLFDKSYEMRPDLGLPILHHLLTTVRKSKIGFWVASQTPSQVGNSILSQSSVKVLFNLGSGQDVEVMTRAFGNLTKEQIAQCYQLAPRQVVVKNTLRYPNPVLGTIPEIPEPRHFSDSEIAGNNSRILRTLPPPVPRVSKVEPSRPTTSERPTQAPSEKPKAADASPVSDALKSLLMVVYNSQYKSTLTEVYKAAGVSAGTGSRIAQRCVQHQFIKIIQLPFGKGSPKYPVMLDGGLKLLGVKERASLGRGALHEHTLCQHLIARHFSEFEPEIEMNRGGKFIDVAVERSSGLVCFEVAMTAVNERSNVDRDIDAANATHVIVACISEAVRQKVREFIPLLSQDKARKTKAVLISELLSSNPREFLQTLSQEVIT